MKIISLGQPKELSTQMPESEGMKIVSMPEVQQESWPQKALRTGVSTASRVLKTAVDIPSQVTKAIGHLGNVGAYGINKLTSAFGLPEQDYLETENIPKISKYTIKPLEKAFLPEDYTKPKIGEEPWHEFVKDVTSLIAPLPGTMGLKLAHAGGVAAAGGLSKWASKQIGLGEGASEGIKLGTMLATSLLGKSGLFKYKDTLYKEAEAALPKKKTLISSEKLQPIIKDLEKTFKKGEMTPSKTFMKARIDAIKSKIKKNMIDVHQAWELKRNMNEYIQDLTKPYGVEKKLPVLSKALANILEEYGQKNQPFLKAFSEAEGIHKGMLLASPVNAFLQQHVSKKHLGKLTGGMLLGYITPAQTAGIAGSALAVKEGVKILERIKNSPQIQKYYAKIVAAAAKRNAPVMNKAVEELDDYLTEHYPENRS